MQKYTFFLNYKKCILRFHLSIINHQNPTPNSLSDLT